MSSQRMVGPFNGVLPAATGTVIGFMRNPNTLPFVNYVQEVPAPLDGNGLYRWCTLQQDMPTELPSLDTPAWGIDDPMKSGDEWKIRAKWDSGQTKRYAFAYNVGDRTQQGWQKGANISLQSYYDKLRLGHAILHRANQVVSAVRGASWPTYNTADLNTLLGTVGLTWTNSSGDENSPGFQVIKRAQNAVMRRVDLTTNGAVTGTEFVMVIGPKVAQKIAESGEIVNYLKQQAGAREDLMVRNKKWGVPDNYNGWNIVVEDTVRCTIKMNADGTVADVSAGEKAYLWDDGVVVFTSRPGGLDGGYGEQSFSTFSLYTYNGPGTQASGTQTRAGVYVKSEYDSWNEITKGAVVTEHSIESTALISGFKLTGVL